MPPLPPFVLPLNVSEAAPLLLRAAANATATGIADDTVKEPREGALIARHARQATSWLAVSFAASGTWERAVAHDIDGALAALAEPLSVDCSVLAAESMGRALHAAPTHARLLQDVCGELCKQLTRRHRSLAPARLLSPRLADVFVAAVRELGNGHHLGASMALPLLLPLPLPLPLLPTGAAAAAATLHEDGGLAIGSALALLAALSNDVVGLRELTSAGALPTLLPYLTLAQPPPKASLNGSKLLANALSLRSSAGTLEQQAEAERQRQREEADGTREAAEAERAALLDAAVPVLLRIVRLHAAAEVDALCLALDALRKLAGNPGAARKVLKHEGLKAALDLAIDWPVSASAASALDASEIIRTLLLTAAHAAALPPPEVLAKVAAADADNTAACVAAGRVAEDAAEDFEPATFVSVSWPPIPPATAVAVRAGGQLGGLLSWVGRVSELHPPDGNRTDEEKTQRGLCDLLCALLCTAPADATLGHPELEALPVLLALMRTQRADAQLQASACETLRMLSGTSATLAKQLARVGTVKTLLLTMRAHYKVAEVHEPASGVLRAIADVSDGCRKLILDDHGVAMLCIVMKKHSLALPLQRDGAACLAALCLQPDGTGLQMIAKEKEGVEVLVGAMLLCAREKAPFEQAKAALKFLADAEPGLLARIQCANGKKWLHG